MKRIQALLLTVSLAFAHTGAFAWGPEGHKTVAAITAELIKGSRAESEIQSLLGELSLMDIAVWPDCAKGIDAAKGYQYQHPGKYPECRVFETEEREAEMGDFVRRNDTNCHPKAGDESCHRQYHYSDIAIQRDAYSLGPVGTRDDDIVHAVVAAAHVLKGLPADSPFEILSKREALLLLIHYAGDLHQPLHVGAIYLTPNGTRLDPDKGTFSKTTETRGGNSIKLSSKNMHATWDAIPASLESSKVSELWLAHAKVVRSTPGDMDTWPAQWATDTVQAAKSAFSGVRFGKQVGATWPGTLPSGYTTSMTATKKIQLTNAGAHLAELLQAIWP